MILYWIFIALLTFILLVYVFLIYYHNNIAIKPIRKKYTNVYIFLGIIELLILIGFILPFFPKIDLPSIQNDTINNTIKLDNDIELNEIKEVTKDVNNDSENGSGTEDLNEEDKGWFLTLINNIFNSRDEEENDPLAFSEENCERGTVDRIKDGDTIVVNGETIRLIGINTPETVDPDKPVQCYGPEASERMRKLVSNKRVCLIKDTISDDLDKHGRKLRYVYLESGKSANEIMLEESFSREYSKYDFGLKEKYKAIAGKAMEIGTGVYNCPIEEESEDEEYNTEIIEEEINENIEITNNEPIKEFVIDNPTTIKTSNRSNCNIKGNINAKGEKIYHVPGCENYNDTIITTSKGEKWFCTEEEARAAGWRKAKNC